MAHLLALTLTVAAVILALGPTAVQCLTDPRLPDIFYAFGSDVGDSVAPVNDDGYTDPVPINIGFPFFNSTRRSVYVNTNGVISFDSGISQFTPDPFPILSASMVAIYWSDVDTHINNGRIYYRETQDATMLSRASRDIQEAFRSQGFYNFQARWIFIATWHNVTYYGGSRTTPTQSFQTVLVTDGTYSFAMFNYGELSWTTGTASGGNASTGLGGTPAQVGFNAGDAINYYAVPWSRTPDIVNIWSSSNIGTTGRWAFRIDDARVTAAGCSKPSGSDCNAWQVSAADNGICTDIAPQFDCPELSGPTAINRLWFEFYCTVPTNVTDPGARFNVTFTFDGQIYDDIPVFMLTSANTRAVLHERYLRGKLGKWISCRAFSYWENPTTQNRSLSLAATNSYKAAIDASDYSFAISEEDEKPVKLLLKSTLPITCHATNAGGNPIHTTCELVLNVRSSTDIAVRQRHPGRRIACSYLFAEDDWKENEHRAYNHNGTLEIRSKRDSFTTLPRLNSVRFYVPVLPHKTINGLTYPNPWSGYELEPEVLVFRYDAYATNAVCSSSGDPRIGTFDGFYYSTYSTGQFYYARSTGGLPFEVHVRHWPCTGVVSCVCGVAVREEDAILAADMCTDGVLHYITYDAENLPNGTGITTTPGGYSFKIQMPSGNKVLANVYPWGINIFIHVSGDAKTEGLCGTRDGNLANDLRVRNTTQILQPVHGQAPNVVIDSWRIPLGRSLFDGHLDDLPRGEDPAGESPAGYCLCEEEPFVCGGPAVSDSGTLSWEPTISVPARVPVSDGAGRKRRSAENSIPTDNFDYTYRATNFTANSNNQVIPSWPTSTGITQSQAEVGCRSRIFNTSNIGPSCYSSLSPENIASILQKCVDDIQISSDFFWVDDKIPELQRTCIDNIVTRNYTELNDTASVIESVMVDISSVTAFTCEPADCSGHGACSNGTCNCFGDYIGSDCALSVSAVPAIRRLVDPSNCDVRTRLCENVNFVTDNTSTAVTCGVQVTLTTGSPANFRTSSRVTSRNTVTCSLPKEPLEFFSNRINFTAYGGPGFDFNQLPSASAVLTYAVSLSNDELRFSSAQTLRVVDTLCMNCDDSGSCTQSPQTCLINGYCFVAQDTNPYNSNDVCVPSRSTSSWTLTNSETATVTATYIAGSLSSQPQLTTVTTVFTQSVSQSIDTVTQRDEPATLPATDIAGTLSSQPRLTTLTTELYLTQPVSESVDTVTHPGGETTTLTTTGIADTLSSQPGQTTVTTEYLTQSVSQSIDTVTHSGGEPTTVAATYTVRSPSQPPLTSMTAGYLTQPVSQSIDTVTRPISAAEHLHYSVTATLVGLTMTVVVMHFWRH